MKPRYSISILGVIAAVIASSVWTSAYAVTFTPPPTSGAPSQATGGASRGSFFTPKKGNSAPSQATGGASRGGFFTPKKGNSYPRTTGGASRGNLFTPKKGNGAPSRAAGGASRGDLFTPNKGNGTPQETTSGASRVGNYYSNPATIATNPTELIALLPESFYGTTVSERPTVMVYVPASGAEEAIFSIKDEVGNMHHKITIPVAGKFGVMAIQLPSEAPALAIGKNYQWFLALKLDGQLSPNTPYVDGWIQRIQPSAELKMAMGNSTQQNNLLQQAEALGKNGVWYDCVATLAGLHMAKPNNVSVIKQWEELLSSVSLNNITTAPLIASAN
jgi:Domain of Unknown Function (DUF928)